MKMLQFAFVAVLALLSVSNFSIELSGFPFSGLHDARLGNFQELCKWFCGDQYYHDYFFRTSDDVQPRIFCGLCKKKISTTTSTTKPSSSTSKGSSPQTSTPSPTGNTTSHSMQPSTSVQSTSSSTSANATNMEVQTPPSSEEMQKPENGTSMEIQSPQTF